MNRNLQPQEDLPAMGPFSLTRTALLALCLAVPAAFAAEPPAARLAAKPGPAWGAADVEPTPENPVYFRYTFGQYPGDTPPPEWWEGTPTTKKVTGIFGNPPRRGEIDALDFTDTKSKNILWKMPVPGWSLSHPIVVGKKVFAVGEPDFVTCWDLDTGKQLWQRRIMPLLCDGMPEDKAAAGQKVLDLARALWLITGGGSTAGLQPGNLFSGGWSNDRAEAPAEGASTADFVAEKRKTAERYLEALAPHRAGVLDAGLKGGVYALDAATGKELACLAGGWLFHLWGDRLVIPGDVNHESMGIPCTYTAVTPGLKDWKLAGAPFAFRDVPGYKGVCGYEVLMIHPFVDGYLFTRAVDVKKGVGVILC